LRCGDRWFVHACNLPQPTHPCLIRLTRPKLLKAKLTFY
jgi:hypothetical protein